MPGTAMTPWLLPESATIGGIEYGINSDFRDVIEIISVLNNPDRPMYVRWLTAIALFYEGEIPPEDEYEAMKYLSIFISYGESDDANPGAVLLDWDQDAQAIIADVNKVAGKEIRSSAYLHWWTFLSYFQAIGEGRLSTLVSIRDKLRRGKKLERWEQEYYRENKKQIALKKRYSTEEREEQDRLKKILGE